MANGVNRWKTDRKAKGLDALWCKNAKSFSENDCGFPSVKCGLDF